MIIRFIYAYKEKSSNIFIYVGSTLNPSERHRCRLAKPRLPIDREIAAHPDAYEMHIVEAFRAETDEESKAVCVLRENQWMDVLNTFRTPHGFNFQRANIPFKDRDSWLASRRRATSSPEFLAKKSATSKAIGAIPEFKKLMSVKKKEMWKSDGFKDKFSANVKKLWKEYPERKTKQAAAQRIAQARPDVIARKSVKRTPEQCARIRAGQYAAWTPAAQKAHLTRIVDMRFLTKGRYYGA